MLGKQELLCYVYGSEDYQDVLKRVRCRLNVEDGRESVRQGGGKC
jgi:hypothetical protein